jgi:phage-related protein (TIGR01555 family)
MEWRGDSWENAVTGLGTLRDKLQAHAPKLRAQLSDASLEALHTEDDICARIVEQLPADALREGFSIAVGADQVADGTTVGKDIDQVLAGLGAEAALREAWVWGRLYGFGAVFLGVDDGRTPDEPLDLNAVVRLTHLNVFRRTQLQQNTYYGDIGAPNYGKVATYRVTNLGLPYGSTAKPVSPGASNLVIHESRMLAFRGVLTSRFGAQASCFWDDSVLQRVYQAVQASSSSWMGAAHLMTDASQGVLKIANLMQLMTAAGEEKLRARIKFLDICRSVARAILLDERESFERIATPFSGIPELLDRFMIRVASAAETPVTVLFGRSPAGMNATGESDVRTWYDKVAAERGKRLTPQIDKLVRVIMATDKGPTKGQVLDGFEVVYPPLWQPTAKERAETLKTTADALATLVNAKVILPEEGAIKLAHSGEFDELDVEAREAALRYELERLAEPEPEPPPMLPPGNGNGIDPEPPNGPDSEPYDA